MANLFDYLSWRGDLDFSQSALNPVDYLIFSQLSYLPLDGIVPQPGGKEGVSIGVALNTLLETEKPVFLFKEDPNLVKALIHSNRFRNCHLFGYVNHIDPKQEVQFSALCVYTGDGSCSVVFRGTDANFVGWKEDLNMSFKEVIPSQLKAVDYLDNIASYTGKSPIRVGGHSKGGNLAVYSSSFCKSKNKSRITEIYCFDAPGFHKNVIATEGFSSIQNLISSFVPQSSVVGMLLEPPGNYNVIKSAQIGLFQHSLYSWEVTYNDLVRVDDIDLSSRFVDKTLKEWMDTLDTEQREKFIDAMYSLLTSANVNSIFDLGNSWWQSTSKMIKSFGSFDESTKKLIGTAFSGLLRSVGKNITLFKPKKNE